MSRRTCAVVACHNCSGKLSRWNKTPCEIHDGALHEDFHCLRPYRLHYLPKDTGILQQWMKALNRKDFVPSKHTVVCSVHFIDGEPTATNPVPQIAMGYERKVKVGRRLIHKHAVTSRLKESVQQSRPTTFETTVEATVETTVEDNFVEINIEATSAALLDAGSQPSSSSLDRPCHIALTKVSQGTQWCDMSLEDHTYGRKQNSKPATRSIGIQVDISDFSAEGLKTKEAKFYTGLELSVFLSLVKVLASVASPTFRMPVGDQILLVLMRLRLGLLFEDLGRRFRISTSLSSKMFSYWLPVMAKTLGDLICWLPRQTIRDKMPASFQELYPKTTVIIDCSEIFIQRPANLRARAQTFSNYKSHNTAKFLSGISPHGLCMFVSRCYGGRASDKFIVNDTGFLNYLLPGDEVMADRGFTIESELSALRVGLNIPAFTRGKTQLPEEDVTRTRRVASVRIHVERAIARIKQYRLLKFTLPAKNLTTVVDHLVIVCAALTNLHGPLIKRKPLE